MKILSIESNPTAAIAEAVTILKAGGIVIFPTETTYGAGVDATNPEAVAKLLAYKSRREGKPLSIAVTDQAMAEQFVEINQSAAKVYQRFLPGPVTVVSKSLGQVAPGVESEFGTLGVRIPDYPLVLELVERLGAPITATSANGSGQKRPYTIQDILDNLSDNQKSLIDLILDAGELPKNRPSTVIDTTLSTPVSLRDGSLVDDLVQATDTTHLSSESETETKKIAGTLLLKHWNQLKEAGLVIALDGPLGAGKTIFTKGLAEFLQIEETITSPTYTYLESYDWTRHGVTGQLHHLDVWKIDTADQFKLLDVPSLLGPNQLVVIEWWQNVAEVAEITPTLKINVADTGQTTRTIQVHET